MISRQVRPGRDELTMGLHRMVLGLQATNILFELLHIPDIRWLYPWYISCIICCLDMTSHG